MKTDFSKYNKTFSTVLLVFLAVFLTLGCEDDTVAYNPDKRLEGISGITFLSLNPQTGAAYTPEEISALGHDPSIEEFFLLEQPVAVNIITEGKPSKVEVERVGTTTLVGTIDSFQEANGSYVGTWNTTIEALGIPEGDGAEYAFYVTYDNAGQNGFETASEHSANYNINHKSAKSTPIFYLSESPLQRSELAFTGTSAGGGVDTFGSFLELNGQNQFLTLTEDNGEFDFTHNDDFSISFWVNTEFDNSDPSIIGDKNWGGGGNKGFVIAFLGSNWKVNIGDGTNRADANGASINDGGWHHLAVTFDRDGDMTIYQDGNALTSEDISGIGDMDSGLPVNIGQDGTGSYGIWYGGKVGGVVLSKYVMTADEVMAEAQMGTGVQFINSLNEVTSLAVDNRDATVGFEENMVTRTFVDPQYSTVQDPSNLLDFRYDSDFSVAVWVKSESDGNDPSIMGDKNWGGGGNKGFVIAFLGDSGWKVNVGDGEGNRADANGTQMNDGEWHLLTTTFDRDGNMTVYQDGAFVSSADMSAIGDMNPAMPINLAQDGTGTYGIPFEGTIGKTYIFDYVLEATDIENLYNKR